MGQPLTAVADGADSIFQLPLIGAMTNRAAPLPPESARRLSGAIASLLLILQVSLGAGSAAWQTAEAYLAGDEVTAVDGVAERAGFGNRHRLRRALTAEGFEGPAHLMGTLRIARWLWVAETLGDALAAQSLRVGQDSAVAYRLIKNRTGLRWSECRRLGATWFIENHLRARLGAPGTTVVRAAGRTSARRPQAESS